MSTTFGAVISLKDNFTVTMRQIRKQQSAFRKDVNSVKKDLEKAYKQKYELRLKNTMANRVINQTVKKLQPLRNHVIKMVARAEMVMSTIKSVSSKLNPLKKIHNVILKGKDAVSPMLSKIKSGLSSLKSMASSITIGAIAGGGAMIGKGVMDGAMLEKQMVSMEHFIGVNNQGKSQAEVKTMADAYLNNLRTNANATPFSTNEVISAGTRALNVAGGNTEMAMSFVRLAQDMAALNPEKSLSDAMEALADLKVGETERMKEFGFKISAEEFKASGGDFSKLTNSEGISLTEMFKGGADKLSTTGSGLMSTILGNLGSGLADMGKSILDALKPILEQGTKLTETLAPKLAQFGTKVGEGIRIAIEWFNKMSPVFTQVAESVRNVVNRLVELFRERFEAMKPSISTFVEFFRNVFPIVKDIVVTVGNKFAEIFSFMSQNSEGLQKVIQVAFPIIQTVISSAWDVLKPILTAIGDAIMILWDCFDMALTGIANVVNWVWEKISPIFNMIKEAVSGVTGAISNVVTSVKGFFGKGNSKVTVENNGGKKRAIGVSRVPKDNYPIMAHEGEVLLTKQEAKGLNRGNAVIEKLADTIVVREDADIDKITNALVRKLEQSMMAYGGAF